MKKYLPIIILSIITALLLFICISQYRSSHQCYLKGVSDGQNDAFRQVTNTVTDVQFLLDTINVPLEENWGQQDYPEEYYPPVTEAPDGYYLEDGVLYPEDCRNGRC